MTPFEALTLILLATLALGAMAVSVHATVAAERREGELLKLVRNLRE